MASKVNTDNPKHHAYVVVNKRERKKERRKPIHRIFLSLATEVYYLIDRIGCTYGGHWDAYASYIPRGTKIIWDDCNHKTYRKMVKRGNGSWAMVMERGGMRPRHFKKPYSLEY